MKTKITKDKLGDVFSGFLESQGIKVVDVTTKNTKTITGTDYPTKGLGIKKNHKIQKDKEELIKYIQDNPEQRLGQAISNFYCERGVPYLYTADEEHKPQMDLFFFEF